MNLKTRPVVLGYPLLMITLLLLTVQCKKNASPPPRAIFQPFIRTAQLIDFCAGKILITGIGFDSLAVEDSVFVGRVKGKINSATSSQIIATMPAGNITGVVTLYCGKFFNTSIDSIYRGITVIDSFAPVVAGTGTMVTISGHYFNADPQSDTVYFNNIAGVVLSASPNKLVARVPPGASSGQVSVRSNCQSASAAISFVNSNKGTVYVGTNGTNFYAIDITSGAPKWTFPMTAGGNNSPTYNNGIVYIGGGYDNNMYALDAVTGAQVWNLKSGPWGGTPVVSQGVLYMGSVDNNFYAFDAASGQKKWAYNSGYDFQSSPTLYNGTIYSANDNGNFYSLNASTGALNWNRAIFCSGNPSAVGGSVYIAGFDATGETSEVYALDAVTGATKWVFPMSSLSGSSPTVVNGVVYIGSGGHFFYAIDAVTGQQIWKTELDYWITSAAQVVNNIVYAVTGSAVLYALNASTGKVLWYFPLDPNGFFQGSPTVANGVVYIGGYSGNVYAIDAVSGKLIWTLATSGYPVFSSPCVVDASGNVFHAGDSGEQQ